MDSKPTETSATTSEGATVEVLKAMEKPPDESGHSEEVIAEESNPLRTASSAEKPSIDGKEMSDLFEQYTYHQIFGLVASEGIHYLGSLTLREGVVMKAFGNENIIWEVCDEYNPENWTEIWHKRLEPARASTAFGPTEYCRAEAYSVTMKNASAPFMNGLLFPIVRKLEMGACSPHLFSSTLIRAVVGFKWHWARKVVFAELYAFLIWLASFLIHATIYDEEDLKRGFWESLEGDSRAQWSTVAALISLLFMLPFSYISICEIAVNGLSHWLTFWNLFDVLAQVNQVVCFLLFYCGGNVSPHTYVTLLGIQTILLVLKIQYFSRAMLQVEVAFIDNLNQLLPEAAAFLLFWLLTLLSFAGAFYCLFRRDLDLDENPEIEKYYGSFGRSSFTLFGSMFKRFTYDPLLDSERSIAVTILFSVFLFLNTVVLYNLIVSIVVSFNKKMKAFSQMKLDTGRAQMVVELETAIPKRFLKKLDKPYIHFLKVLPPEDIDVRKLWTQVGYSEEGYQSRKEVLTTRLAAAEHEIMTEIEDLSNRIKEMESKSTEKR